MKIVVYSIVSSKESWFEEAQALYLKKMQHFIDFEIVPLKASKIERLQSEQKKKSESELILKQLRSDDFVVLMDERGKSFNSIDFAKWLEKEALVSSGSKRFVFIIGGAFGVSEELASKAKLKLQMGPWTLNHFVAQIVLLEQLYRAFTIIKGIPYHNA